MKGRDTVRYNCAEQLETKKEKMRTLMMVVSISIAALPVYVWGLQAIEIVRDAFAELKMRCPIQLEPPNHNNPKPSALVSPDQALKSRKALKPE